MERKFYPEDFEKFLKQQADQFKMSPSKKSWHGIYNDLHPERRWPSVTMGLLFIFTFVIIGHLNTNNEHKKQLAASLISGVLKSSANNSKNTVQIKNINQDQHYSDQDNVDQSNTSAGNNDNDFLTVDQNLSSTNEQAVKKNNVPVNENVADKISSNNNTGAADKNIYPVENNLNNTPLVASTLNVADQNNSLEVNQTWLKNSIPNQQISLLLKQNLKSKITSNAVIKNIKVRKSSLTWTYYIMPSVSYRHLSSAEINNAVFQKPIIGREAGAHFSYRLSRRLQFTTGVQLDYSGYSIKTSNVHPTVASILLNGEFSGQTYTYTAMSNYGNTSGMHDTKLKNYSVQTSLPVGFSYNFAGNENIKFNAEATFQPMYVIAEKAYMLSTDQKNYLTAPDLMRRWNMSTNLGTFISFRSNSFNWEIGPEIHYQLLSTYTNKYPFAEHLVNYGIHFGVSKILK